MSMLPTDDRLKYKIGSPTGFTALPLPPFDSKTRSFLAQLSVRLIADPATKTMPDVLSFAWWCRKSNIEHLAKNYSDGVLRIGRGIAFHITPTNMPVNFAFSWAFSLLAGNANIVRLPNRDFPQIPFLVSYIGDLLDESDSSDLGSMNAFVSYGREDHITEALSAISDVRLIWGGDATIRAIRRMPLPVRSVDIGFADRYSFCVMGAEEIAGLNSDRLQRLASDFYNDAYIMDQNACSSPRLVIWRGADEAVSRASERFWDALRAVVEMRYQLPAGAGAEKVAQACRDAIDLECLDGLTRSDPRIYRLALNAVPLGIESRRCGSGYFYEYATSELDDLAPIVSNKYQTLTYFGLPKEELAAFVRRNRLTGIDRIVPVGKAMDIGLIWDGYDLIRILSRVCDVC